MVIVSVHCNLAGAEVCPLGPFHSYLGMDSTDVLRGDNLSLVPPQSLNSRIKHYIRTRQCSCTMCSCFPHHTASGTTDLCGHAIDLRCALR